MIYVDFFGIIQFYLIHLLLSILNIKLLMNYIEIDELNARYVLELKYLRKEDYSYNLLFFYCCNLSSINCVIYDYHKIFND